MSCPRVKYPPAIISEHAEHNDLPERGARVISRNKGHKTRLLVGWRHQDDTPEALQKGRIWCWVGVDKFQVYDETYNRSDQAGEVRFCGVANFTMIRMFHPWFARYGCQVPQDMVSSDKKWCRNRYWQAILQYRLHDRANGEESDDDAMDDDEDNGGDDAPITSSSSTYVSAHAGNSSFGRKGGVGVPDSDTDMTSDGSRSDQGSEDDGNNDDDDDADNAELDYHTTRASHETSSASPSVNSSTDRSSPASDGTSSVSPGSRSSTTVSIKTEDGAGFKMVIDSSAESELDQDDAILAATLQSFNDRASNPSIPQSRILGTMPRTSELDPSDGQDIFFPDPEIELTGLHDTSPTPAPQLATGLNANSIKDEDDECTITLIKLTPNELQRIRSQGAKDDPIDIE